MRSCVNQRLMKASVSYLLHIVHPDVLLYPLSRYMYISLLSPPPSPLLLSLLPTLSSSLFSPCYLPYPPPSTLLLSLLPTLSSSLFSPCYLPSPPPSSLPVTYPLLLPLLSLLPTLSSSLYSPSLPVTYPLLLPLLSLLPTLSSSLYSPCYLPYPPPSTLLLTLKLWNCMGKQEN